MTWSTPSNQEIKDILVRRVDVEADGLGLAVGVVDASEPRIVSHGPLLNDSDGPCGDTLFEIGSNTKVFTALLLTEMAERGEVRLSDPVAELLPPGVRIPERGGRRITLADLAAHTSGLPRDADNYGARRRTNPFADYTVERLYEFLSGHQLQRDIGVGPSYSNVGMGLLGHALSLRAGTDYETLVRERITGPLGMTSTVVTLSPDLQARSAEGHDTEGFPTENLDLPAIPGAGALRSTANDLLVFLAAEVGLVETNLASAMSAQLSVRVDAPGPDLQSQALGWGISLEGGQEVFWHVGRTTGFRCFMGFAPETRVGIVVLGNMATRRAGEDIGFHLLTGKPIAPIGRLEDVRVDAEALQACVGRYRLSSGRQIDVSAAGDRLVFDPPGRNYEFHASSFASFFLKQFDVQATFDFDRDGRAKGLLIRQNGRDLHAARID